MITMTAWIYIIKTILKSTSTKGVLRNKIITTCLYQKNKVFGAYQVNHEKVWENVILKDKNCLNTLEELKIDNVYKLMNYYREIEYKMFRHSYPRNRRKYG